MVLINQSQKQQEKSLLIQVPSANDIEILAYLRRSAKFAEIAALAERDVLILTMCEQLGITASDEEWQATGDAFRREHQLFGTMETLAWLEKQRIRAEEWSQGMRVALLERKLKEYLFGLSVDRAYMINRDNYRRVALSQIVVVDLSTAQKIVQILQQGSATFCALALAHSNSKLSSENGGFQGIRYLVELYPEIAAHVTNSQEGEVIGPIQTNLGYHILRIEKWFPSEFNKSTRETIMDMLFQMWLKNLHHDFGIEI
ncbi:peptidylprolyl isomerase [Calothrix sp. PCC 7507]|uniref:peptidylprolyl isomerase n=1 Tax=Calothrix sp. PCC 7507 TaxID=99598 RepID=UPI00029ECE5E|nr:peptidylprolyl isomerase [Calothrix sp. PCC 7507]AFY32112.1 PpiC-type peptidyl-prolyl cis-trans isomerase [Calothrix sp. PCC 7507]